MCTFFMASSSDSLEDELREICPGAFQRQAPTLHINKKVSEELLMENAKGPSGTRRAFSFQRFAIPRGLEPLLPA